jgi:hypothetical protein
MQILITLLLCIPVHFALAQNARITGSVKDKNTGESIIFGTVFLEGTRTGCITDIDGNFVIPAVEPGTYTVVAACIGMDTVRHTVTVKGSEALSLDIEMSVNTVRLHAGCPEVYREPLTDPDHQPGTILIKEIKEIKVTPEEEPMFIVPALYNEPKRYGTIDVLNQAGAFRINFPEPPSAR